MQTQKLDGKNGDQWSRYSYISLDSSTSKFFLKGAATAASLKKKGAVYYKLYRYTISQIQQLQRVGNTHIIIPYLLVLTKIDCWYRSISKCTQEGISVPQLLRYPNICITYLLYYIQILKQVNFYINLFYQLVKKFTCLEYIFSNLRCSAHKNNMQQQLIAKGNCTHSIEKST